mmetsp:Transcript_9619/g.29286  ORF Transcript_9619/g.29286 Transcript_9619/m.29286 type:complete len:99 (-) Transcript_9619:3860-4156(-)
MHKCRAPQPYCLYTPQLSCAQDALDYERISRHFIDAILSLRLTMPALALQRRLPQDLLISGRIAAKSVRSDSANPYALKAQVGISPGGWRKDAHSALS